MKLIAKTFQGLETVLAEELKQLGATEVVEGRRMVAFQGDKRLLYKANFVLRTAIRILKPLTEFKAGNADEVYEQVKSFPWETVMSTEETFAVDAVVFSDEFRHSKFVSYKVKDAIADYFRQKTGKRPSVRIHKPDILIHIHIAQTTCTLCLDSSGESLHRRGYRNDAVIAPLNEVLAAGMILQTGWRGECDFVDPMCGSGTLLIEAALIAHNIAPGIFRKDFGFERWKDFDKELFEEIYHDDSAEREFSHKIYGFDNSLKAVLIAQANVKGAGLSKTIQVEQRDVENFQWEAGKAIMVTNPPYGERIAPENLLDLYAAIGRQLKKEFAGNTAWILSYKDECFDKIGLKPSKKIMLYNGALPCQFREYTLFSGNYKDYKTQQNSKGKRAGKERDASREGKRKSPKGGQTVAARKP